MRDSRGLIYSSTLHGVILALLIFGLPNFFDRDVEMEPEAVSVEILPIAPVSNVKPQDMKQPEDKRPIAEKNTERKSAPPTKQEAKEDEPPPVPLPQKQKPIEKKKPEKKKAEKKKEEDPLKAILNDVKEHSKVEESDRPTRTRPEPNAKPAKSQHFDPGAPLSMSDRDAIRQQIENKWSPPIGAKDAKNLKVKLHIMLNPDGTVTSVEPEDMSRYNSDSFFRAAVDSAVRAVKMASPLKNLPADKYNVRDGWNDMDIVFDPSDVL